MSTLKVNTIGNKGSAVDFPNKLKVRGNAIEQGYTASGTEPVSYTHLTLPTNREV